MKITTQQIRQLIKEELQSVMKEQGQLEEGVGLIAGLMATLFSPGVDKLEINDVELDRNQFQAVLQIIGEESPNALNTLEDDLKIFGVQDKDRDGIKDVDVRLLNPDQTNAIVSGVVKSKQAKQAKDPKAGEQDFQTGDIKMKLVQLQGAINVNGVKSDGAKKVALSIMQHPEFKTLDTAEQKKVKKVATGK